MILGLAVAACDGSDESRQIPPEFASQPTDPAPSLVPPPPCPNQEKVAGDESLRTGSLAGDVSGDGVDDRVHVAVDDSADIGCRAFLLVAHGDQLDAVALEVEGLDPALGLPALRQLKQVDGAPGADIIVDLIAGASTVFAGVYSMATGEPARVTIQGSEPPARDLFPYGGGVGQLSAVDCTDDGTILISSAVPQGARYLVTRNRYASTPGARLREGEASTRKVKLEALPARFPEFAGPPFRSCPAG
jgi:hypothetical protein